MLENESRRHRDFIGYEYKEVSAEAGQISFLIDGYENFGWEVDENAVQYGNDRYPEKTGAPHQRKIMLRLKRNRKIVNKMELTRLQRNFEACVAEIKNLEKEKTSRPGTVCGNHRNCLYGRLHFCRNSRSSSDTVMHYFGCSGISGLDISLFFV